MRLLFAAIFLIVLLSNQTATAMSGAEFLQNDKTFSEGYAWGVLEYEFNVVSPNDSVAFKKTVNRRECLLSSQVNSSTLYDLVRQHIMSDPLLAANGAVGAIIQVIRKMCPEKTGE